MADGGWSRDTNRDDQPCPLYLHAVSLVGLTQNSVSQLQQYHGKRR